MNFKVKLIVVGMLLSLISGAAAISLAGCSGSEETAVSENTESSESGAGSDISSAVEEEPEGPVLASDEEKDEWYMVLVNKTHKIDETFEPETKEISPGYFVDERIYDALKEMLDDCNAEEGNALIVCSAYRSYETQQMLYQDQINYNLGLGMDQEEAEEEAGTVVAVPGTSEHQTGLAVDLMYGDNIIPNDSIEQTPEWDWLMENAWKYGFILRFPEDKEDITGIIYEAWHFRYVGKDAAKKITEQDMCLEEYLDEVDIPKYDEEAETENDSAETFHDTDTEDEEESVYGEAETEEGASQTVSVNAVAGG